MVEKKKTLKNLFSRTKKVLRLDLGIVHQGLKVYQVCSNDDPRLTFDLFLRNSQICVLVAVAILEECCMASAAMQLLFYSGVSRKSGFFFVLNL